MVEPTGVPATIEIRIPIKAHNTDNTTEQTVTLRKLLNILIAESAGKITSADLQNIKNFLKEEYGVDEKCLEIN